MALEPAAFQHLTDKAKFRISGLILLSALCAEIYFLLYDVPILRSVPSKNEPSSPAIAELVRRNNTVRVQEPGSLVWEDSRNGQTLHRRESILTLDHSKAEIAFLDGTGIVIDENSMITLEKTPTDDSLQYQKIVITLLRGTVHKRAPRQTSQLLKTSQTQSTPDIEIKTPDLTIPIPAMAEFSLMTSPEGTKAGTRLIVQSGELTAASEGGKTTIKAGEEATQLRGNEKQAPTAKHSNILLQTPRSGENVTLDPDSKLMFKFEVAGAAEGAPLEIEVSSDPAFEKEVIRRKIAASQPALKQIEAAVRLPRSSGKWFWRVRALDSQLETSAENFWINAPVAPRLLYPTDRSKRMAGKPLDFSWEGIEGAMGYELEAGPTHFSVETPFANVPKLPEGEISWKVRAKLKDGSMTGWSAQRSLSSIAEAEAAPPPPAEISEPEIIPAEPAPKHSSVFEFIAAAYAEELKSWIIHLKWQAVTGVSKYRIQIGRERTFQTILAEVQADSTSWDWPFRPGMENSKGRVFFRVASVSSSGKVGAFSPPKIIQIPSSILSKTQKPVLSPRLPSSQPAPSRAAEPVSSLEPDSVSSPTPEPEASPTPAPTPSPTPVPAPQADAPVRKFWSANAQLHTGLGSMKQTSSDATLESVSLEKAFLQQKATVGFSRQVSERGLLRGDEIFASLGFMSFHRPSAQVTGPQPDIRALSLQAVALKTYQTESSPYIFKLGLIADKPFDFEKISAQAVGTFSSLSIGPAVEVVHVQNNQEIGARTLVPLSGKFTGGFWAIQSDIWVERKLHDSAHSWIGGRMEAEWKLSRWKRPENAQLSSWAVWLAPTFHFGEEETP